tara:strand:+ start:12094 stop:13068 length:975 start_codon:yes stop_codon:yes gene_type:complete
MSEKRPIGVFILGDIEPENIIPLSKKVEEYGFDELWFAEDYFMISGFASAAMALQATKTIKVGVGIVSAVVRHPSVTAMEASTISRAYPGRFTLGIGHGVPAWIKQMDLYPKSVLSSMRESVTSIKRLLAGEEITQKGEYFSFDRVALTHPDPNLSVLTGVVGPKSIDLCADIADGMIVSVLGGPKYVQAAHNQISKRRGDSKFKMVTYALCSVGDDIQKKREDVRSATAFYLNAMGPTYISDIYGISHETESMIKKGGARTLESAMPDEWLDFLAIAGSPKDCEDSINQFFEAGSSSVVLCIVPTESLAEQLQKIGQEVLPNL